MKPFDSQQLKQQVYRPRGIGWVRRAFKFVPSERGKSLELQFGGLARRCAVDFRILAQVNVQAAKDAGEPAVP